MGWDARTDKNQGELVDAWRKMGGSALLLHRVGQGCPDLLLGMYGEMVLVEVKTESGRLSDRQKAWREEWRGPKPRVLRNLDELQELQHDLYAASAMRYAQERQYTT